MPVVEVACPGCGAKLKAPDTKAGKKAKCGKCGKTFRIPGVPVGDSVGEPQALSVLTMPVPQLPDDDATEVMMAEAVDAVEVTLPLPATPAKNLSALPSADPFDFGKSAASAKPAFGAAKAAPPPTAKPQAAPAPAAKPQAAKPAAPAKPAPLPPMEKAKAPEPAPLSLDDDDFQPIEPPPVKKPLAKEPPAKAKAAPLPEPEPEELPAESNPFADNPFAFSGAPEKSEKPTKSKRRDEDDEPSKKSRKKSDEDEPPPKSKAKSAPKEEREESGGFNPFAAFDGGSAEPAPKDEKPAKSKRREEDDKDDKKPKKKRKGDEDESEEPATPRYRRPEEQGGTGKMLLIMGVIGLFALGLGIVAVVMYVKNNKKEPEQQAKKDEKKDEAPPPMPPVQPAPPDPKPKDKNPDPKSKDPDPKPKDPEPKPKDPDPGPAPALTRPALDLGKKLRSFTVGPLPPMTEAADPPRAGMVLEVPLASVKRVFPPFDPKSADTFVLIQTNTGFNGKGEKLALDSYGPAKNLVATVRIEYDGDGSPVPIADLSASPAGAHFLAVTGGKLHVWSVADKKKIADGVDPYAEKPEHAKAGLAAAFFSAADLNQVVTVSTAGAVLLYDLTTNKAVSEFIPPNGAPGKVAFGLSVAKADGNGSVVIAVAGGLYQVKAVPGLEVLRKYDLGGDVGRSLGLAVSGTPGRLLYVFETVPDKVGKKDKAVIGLPLGDKAKHILYAFPASAGEPKGALWANGIAGGVATDRGVLWFDDDEGKFLPMFLTQSAGGQYFGDERYFWYVVAHPKEPGKSGLVALSVPFNDFGEYLNSFAKNQPLRAVKIDGNGLSK
jgi:hypothetical protein